MADFVQPKVLVQFVGSGGTARVEEEWMRLVESPQATPEVLAAYQPIFVELAARDKKGVAEGLAWAAVEVMVAKHGPERVLPMAGAFLQALGDSADFRAQVADLYRTTHADREGLDELMREAGIAGGRPARRAIRTLEVCLAVSPGDYLVSREGDAAAQIHDIDTGNWQFTIRTGQRVETLGAVHLADQWLPAAADDFRVLRQFDPKQLRRRLEEDPVSVLTELCKRNEKKIDSEALAEMLAPDLVPEKEWKTWWSKARAALKKSPNFRVEGRSPYTIIYDDTPVNYSAQFVDDFNRHRDPVTRFELVEKYLKECAARGDAPGTGILVNFHSTLRAQARELIKAKDPRMALAAAIAAHVGRTADVADAESELFEIMRAAGQPARLIATIRRDDLLELAVKAMIDARPQIGRNELLAILPTLPQSYCDRAVEWLVQGGCTPADLAPVVQKILAAPVTYFDALLWLWDGPALGELVRDIPPLTILMRILRAMTEARLSDSVGKEQCKIMVQHAKSVLAARGFERFERALQGIDSGMALALRNQINQVDSLGRAVQDGLLQRVSPHLPKREAGPALLPWEREDVIYTTEAGFARKQNDIDHHVNVKMRENAIAIGAAAEKGDLSENSEYKFALEERDLLRARLAQMNAELQSARVLSPDDVPTDLVGVGTRVVFRRQSDGEIYEITFVGPWESDYEKHRINYKAPLAKSVLGKRVGETVEFDHTGAKGIYEIVELHNGLREMAAQEV
jgi:transcription elongation factor GreA